MTSIDVFIAQQNASGGQRGTNGIGLEYNAAVGSVPTGGNAVIGLQPATFTGGYNAIILDGDKGQYGFSVDATGAVSITDHTGGASNGNTVNVSGASYIVFSGAATSGSEYQQIALIANTTNAALAETYQAALGRQPDLAGLEFWESALANGTYSLTTISDLFLHSQEFATRFGDVSNMDNTAFAKTLYANILGRTPDPSGLSFWVHDLDSGDSRENVLITFAGSAENLQKVGFATGGWLITTGTGGYATPDSLLPATTVLNQAASTGHLDTSLINMSGVSTLSASGIQLLASGARGAFQNEIWTIDAGAFVVSLSSTINEAVVGSNSTVYGAATGNSTVWVGDGLGAGGFHNTTIVLYGNSNHVVIDGSSNTVTGFNSTDSIWLSAATNPVSIINVGNIGNGSAAEVAAAANNIYHVTSVVGEQAVFVGTTASGDTVVSYFGALAKVGPGTSYTPGSQQSADANGNHSVDAAELTESVTLVGIPASDLSASQFHVSY